MPTVQDVGGRAMNAGSGTRAAAVPVAEASKRRLDDSLKHVAEFKMQEAFSNAVEPDELGPECQKFAVDYVFWRLGLFNREKWIEAQAYSHETGEPLVMKEPKKVLAESSFSSIKTGLGYVFDHHGHTGPFMEWPGDGAEYRCKGNPTTNNPGMEKLKIHHVSILADEKRGISRVRPLLLEHVAAIGRIVIPPIAAFGFDRSPLGHVCDSVCADAPSRCCYRVLPTAEQLFDYEVWVMGNGAVNMGRRMDELEKLLDDGVVITPGEGVECVVRTPTKTSVKEVRFSTRAYLGCSGHGLFVDAEFGFSSWSVLRGPEPGHFFPMPVKAPRSKTVTAFDMTKSITSPMVIHRQRDLLERAGMSPAEAMLYAGHSPKRGCVQVYRGFGFCDSWIQAFLKMVGKSFWIYSEHFNNERPDIGIVGSGNQETLWLIQGFEAQRKEKVNIALLSMKTFEEIQRMIDSKEMRFILH